MREAARGNRMGVGSLCVMILGIGVVAFAWIAAAGRDDGLKYMVDVILKAVLPLAVLAVMLGVAGLQKDRTQLLASISLALLPASLAVAWLIGWIGQAF